MPPNGTGYYQLLEPIQVGSQPTLDFDHLAVNYGVKAIQTRINRMGYLPALVVDGNFGPTSDVGLRWAQQKMGVTVDGQAGPNTCLALYWPTIKSITQDPLLRHTVGGIAMHESAYDPGAVGYTTPDDHGLVQINAPANPNITIAQAFDFRFALTYCVQRISNAMNTYHNIDIAICSYASPLWAQEWAQTGQSPNRAMTDYVSFVKNWVSPA